MAAIDDTPVKKKPNDFGDAASGAATQVGAASPALGMTGAAGAPPLPAAAAPLGMISTGMSPTPALAPVNNPAPVVAAPVAPPAAAPAVAQLGMPAYVPPPPNPNTPLTLAPVAPAALPQIPSAGVLTLPGQVAPQAAGMGAQTAAAGAGYTVPSNAGVAPTPATQAEVRAVDNNPANSAAIAAAPLAPDSYAAAGGVSTLNGVDPASRVAQMNRDTAAQKALDDAKVAQQAKMDQPPGLGIIGNPGPADAQAMFNAADLRTAAAKGSWSPRLGYRGDAGAVAAAEIPIQQAAKAQADQLAANTSTTVAGMRDAGDTARANIAQTGETTRSAATDQIRQGALGVQQAELGIKQRESTLDIAGKARLDAAAQAITTAKTPEAQRAATERYNALAGRAKEDNFGAIEVGGGNTVDAVTGLSVPQPKSVVIYNKATGAPNAITPGAAPAAAAPIAEGSTNKDAKGRAIVYKNGAWAYQ